MEKEYSYKDNIIWFAEKQIIFSEKIAEIIEFEKFLVIRNNYLTPFSELSTQVI